jgi:hypothetical protein
VRASDAAYVFLRSELCLVGDPSYQVPENGESLDHEQSECDQFGLPELPMPGAAQLVSRSSDGHRKSVPTDPYERADEAHRCMSLRSVRAEGSRTVTSALEGIVRNTISARGRSSSRRPGRGNERRRGRVKRAKEARHVART